MTDIVCTGPGPHVPPSGLLGTTTADVAPTGMRCTAAACRPPVPQATINATTLRARAENAIADLALIKRSSGVLTGAQLSNAVRSLATALLAIMRLQLARLDDTDE